MLRVLLAEDQALVALLTLEGDIEIVAEVGRGDEIVPRALDSDPDVALSEGIVRNDLSAAIQKLGTRDRLEVARLAEQKGWLLSGSALWPFENAPFLMY